MDGLLHDATRPAVPAATVWALITLVMSPPPPNRSHLNPGNDGVYGTADGTTTAPLQGAGFLSRLPDLPPGP